MNRGGARPGAGGKPKKPRGDPFAGILSPRLSCPRKLSKEERAVWRQLAPLVAKLGANEADVPALTHLCQLQAQYDRALEQLRGAELVLETEKGSSKHPAVQIFIDIGRQIALIRGEFGLTMPSRYRMAPSDQPKPDEKSRVAEFLEWKGGKKAG